MQAIAVCKRLFDLSLSQPRVGTVHSVFDHAVNLDLGLDGLIGLIAEDKALTPYAVSVRTNAPFTQLGVRAGMAAYLREGILAIPEAGISLDITRATQADLSVDSIALCSGSEAEATLEFMIVDVLTQADAGESLAALVTGGEGNAFTRFLAPRLARLFAAVSQGAWEEATVAAANCAGCGMGLTPSSDDLLCGYFLTLHLLYRAQSHTEKKAQIETLAQAAAGKTNRISGTFLLQSGMALANDALYELYQTIFTSMDQLAADRAIARVLKIGSTSGADTLTGIVLALRQNNGGSKS